MALMPPQQATASPDRAAALIRPLPRPTGRSRRVTVASGRMIQGSIARGRYSEELMPITASACGLSAYAIAPARRAPGEPMPSRSASRRVPTNAAHSNSASQNRWTIQAGSPIRCPST